VTDWVTSIIEAAGYVGIALLMALECVFPPIPSEAILPFVGFSVGEGDMSFPLALAAATAGSLAGNLALYVVARRGGRALVEARGARLGATPERVARMEGWMRRHGRATVLVARAVPVARSVVSLPAGLARFGVVPFVVLTTLGSAVWNGALIGLGWALDDAWHRVEDAVGGATLVVIVLAVVGVLVAWVLARRRRSRGAAHSS
jgi:membrane protein DedA with SNARE-associated domain